MFDNTLALVDDCGLAYLHVFPYSERSGTPAARMPQVAKELRRERAARLRARGEARLDDFLSGFAGARAEVLVEKPRLGRSAHYAAVALDADAEPGRVIPAHIIGHSGGALHGTLSLPPS
jgi:threonylcarbamoyladenosine tRNA methylthiotransferase MtaB